MHELFSAADYGTYADKTTGKMQLCFLTNIVLSVTGT